VPFVGPGCLTIRLEDRNARFEGEPRVFAGCKVLTAKMNKEHNEWSLKFDALPPYDSWTIMCNTNVQADVTFAIAEGDNRPSHSAVTLNGTESSMLVGTDVSPGRLLAGLVILSGECAYFAPVLLGWPYPGFYWADPAVGFALALFGVLVFSMISRKPHPVVQGYWKPSIVGAWNDDPAASSPIN
jgi:hypothetical protein